MIVAMAVRVRVVAIMVVRAVIMAATAIGAMFVRMLMTVTMRMSLHVQHVAGRLVIMAMIVMVMIVVRVIVVRVIAMVMATAAIVAMGVAGMIVMGMVVMGMVVMSVAMMAMRFGRLIGAAFWLERSIDDGDGGAKAAHHFFQHRIAGDADAVGKQLGRDVTVAEVPGEAGQMVRVAGDDLGHRLLSRHHRNGAAIVQRQAIAMLQARGFLEIQQKHHIALPAHRDPAAVATVMRQHHAVSRPRNVPGAGGQKRAGVDHDRLLEAAGRAALDD